ncbi:MAG: tetratricopeptide repeat protein [Roseovarius sp.]|nr:tetratricopeptide repeat protein [Roseovarius sp.]
MENTARSLALMFAILAGASASASDKIIGPYISARQAMFESDYEVAAKHFAATLSNDPSNPRVLELSALANALLGDLDSAIPPAKTLYYNGNSNLLTNLVILADYVRRDAHEEAIEMLSDERITAKFISLLSAAWVHAGAGNMRESINVFDSIPQKVIDVNDKGKLNYFIDYHKALALASAGDFETAGGICDSILSFHEYVTSRSLNSCARILSQIDRHEDAMDALEKFNVGNGNIEAIQIRSRLEEGAAIPFTMTDGAADGVAEVLYTLAGEYADDTGTELSLMYANLAKYLNPDLAEAAILSAKLYNSLGQHELAIKSYKRVTPDHPLSVIAELGRADTLHISKKSDAAIEVIENLAKSHPESYEVHVSLGEIHRQLGNFEDAVIAYDNALAVHDANDPDKWYTHYVRGICFERMDQWPNAEFEFRKALALNPDHPNVLNYLGYSLVEKRTNLNEALDMIERAVAVRPNSGYIVDSLGWVLYRLGRYHEAILHMERAAELTPTDVVVNDHLGDVLWAVGRRNEARFHWKRALSFMDPDNPQPDVDFDRIRLKQKLGLDAVLAKEGAPPLKAAHESD